MLLGADSRYERQGVSTGVIIVIGKVVLEGDMPHSVLWQIETAEKVIASQ